MVLGRSCGSGHRIHGGSLASTEKDMPVRELTGESDGTAERIPWMRRFVGIVCGLALVVAILAGVRLATVWSLYAYLLHLAVQETGLDLRWARPVVLAAMALVSVVPWWSFMLPWRAGRRRRAVLAGLLMAGLSAGLGFATKNVFFDAHGAPARFYAVVPGGYRLSFAAGVERQYGVVFRPITPTLARQILAWERAGRSPRMQSIPCDPAFDLYSGDPICWFDKDHDGRLRFSPVPGFDPETGVALESVTGSVIEQFESMTRREAQRRRTIDSAEFHSIRVVVSDPPPFASVASDSHEEIADRLGPGTQIIGELLLPKQLPQLPAPETPDGLIALAVQQAIGLVPRERLLFRITNDVAVDGTILLPRQSVAEGFVNVWSAPQTDHEIRVTVEFSRIWLRGRTRPVALRAHLVGGNSLLVMGAINAVCLDEPFGGRVAGRRHASSANP
jgi:hypothetical protein